MAKGKINIITLVALISFFSMAKAQTTLEQFGQNRVQYHGFTWTYFQSENFETYFYQGGQEIGQFVIEYAETEIDEISKQLDFAFNKRMHIMVYSDITDLNQTNIGQELPASNVGGNTKVVDNKMFVYFNGDHDHLKQQIRRGIAQVIVSKMLFGSSFQEVLQNAVLLNLPNWFTLGLIEYVAEDWSTEHEERLRDGIRTTKFSNLNDLSEDETVFVGHSFWHYLETIKGEEAVTNLLYVTRINRSVESGFLYVLNQTVDEAFEEWFLHYKDRYLIETNNRDEPDLNYEIRNKTKKFKQYYNYSINPYGNKIAYVANELGRYVVQIKDLGTKEVTTILRGGFKTQTLVTDFNYPLIDWNSDGSQISVIYEWRDQIKLLQYDVFKEEKTVKDITKFQRIFDFSYAWNDDYLIFSGMQRGRVDLYTYYVPTTTTEQLTDDLYDDRHPVAVTLNGVDGVLFASNRTRDTLNLGEESPQQYFDLFFYDYTNQSNALARVTNTPLTHETYPKPITDRLYQFLSDENGIRNHYRGYLKEELSHYATTYQLKYTKSGFRDSVSIRDSQRIEDVVKMNEVEILASYRYPVYKKVGENTPTTNLTVGIENYDFASGENENLYVHLLPSKNQYQLYRVQLDSNFKSTGFPVLKDTDYRNFITSGSLDGGSTSKKEGKKTKKQQKKAAEKEQKAEPYQPQFLFFQSAFDYPNTYYKRPKVEQKSTSTEGAPKQKIQLLNITEEQKEEPIFKKSRSLPYQVEFSTDNIAFKLDNNLLITPYARFDPSNPTFTTPPLGFAFQVGIKDLMEDYRIYGGFRIPTSISNTEFFITYENVKKRLDKRLTYYRKAEEQVLGPGAFVPFNDSTQIPTNSQGLRYQIRTNYTELNLNYALDVLKSFRVKLGFRNDRYIFKVEDEFSLSQNAVGENWAFTRMEFVHDHTIDVQLNIKNGFRYKFWAEIHKQIPTEDRTIAGDVDVPLPRINDTYFGVLGADIRHYQKVHKNIVLANRVAAGTSFGNAKLVYYLGGVDGWIGSDQGKFDQTIPINRNNNYAFQTLATNLRGFKYNIRNGNHFIATNTELRVPIFSYLFKSPLKSDFLRNFQLVGFFDAGTAWEGASPYNRENPLFSADFGNPEEVVRVNINYYRNPIVFGYGAGARMNLLGYFVRADFAWGVDTGEHVNEGRPTIYISLNKDF